MKDNIRLKRQKEIEFALGLASIDGGQASSYTEQLLKQYKEGMLSAREVREAIVKEYTKDRV